MAKKGNCSQCSKNNVLINYDTGLCMDCSINNARLEIQASIKEDGLKSAQIQWEIMKPQIEKEIEEVQQSSDLTPEEKKELKKGFDKFFQTIEDDLFPERKKARESRKN